MAYSKQNWRNGDPDTPLSAERMGHIENGIDTNSTQVGNLLARLTKLEGRVDFLEDLQKVGDPWVDGEVYFNRWQVMSTGFGTVTGDLNKVALDPAHPTSLSETHSALVRNTQALGDDIDFVVTVNTIAQTRKNDPPNPWECSWVMWDWTSNQSFYAVALKPNGWEISQQNSAYDGNQRFIASNTTPAFEIGVPYRIWVKRTAGETYVRYAVEDLTQPDGIPESGWQYLWHFTDTEAPLSGGSVAFYNEDATTEFSGLVIR